MRRTASRQRANTEPGTGDGFSRAGSTERCEDPPGQCPDAGVSSASEPPGKAGIEIYHRLLTIDDRTGHIRNTNFLFCTTGYCSKPTFCRHRLACQQYRDIFYSMISLDRPAARSLRDMSHDAARCRDGPTPVGRPGASTFDWIAARPDREHETPMGVFCETRGTAPWTV